MSGLHVVQCLCHGQMFVGRVIQSTGDIALQVCINRGLPSALAHLPHILFHQRFDPSTHPELFQHLAMSSAVHPDPFNTLPGLPPTPENQLPQLTALPAAPPPAAITQNYLSMPAATFDSSASTLVKPTMIPPPAPLCGCGLCLLPEVPQRRYQSTQISGDADSRIGETVTFSKGACGIPLRDAVENRLSGLVGGDDPMFDGFNVTAFSLRIEVRPLS